MNIELCNICNWLAVNKLSVDVSKTKFMVFHPHQKDVKDQIPNLKINDSDIELVENLNFLGMQLDKNLNRENSHKLNRQQAIWIFRNIESIETLFTAICTPNAICLLSKLPNQLWITILGVSVQEIGEITKTYH